MWTVGSSFWFLGNKIVKIFRWRYKGRIQCESTRSGFESAGHLALGPRSNYFRSKVRGSCRQPNPRHNFFRILFEMDIVFSLFCDIEYESGFVKLPHARLNLKNFSAVRLAEKFLSSSVHLSKVALWQPNSPSPQELNHGRSLLSSRRFLGYFLWDESHYQPMVPQKEFAKRRDELIKRYKTFE